jgi:hypothetical protein
MVSEIEFGGLVFVVNFLARWAHFILELTIYHFSHFKLKPLRSSNLFKVTIDI